MLKFTGASRAVFIDKDGTLIENLPYNVDPSLIRLAPRAVDGMRELFRAGYLLIVVSNQSGVALGRFREEDLIPVENRVRQLLGEAGIPLAGFYYCPHHPAGSVPEYSGPCECRKPKPGLILTAAVRHNVSLFDSWFIGDILDDVEAGHRAGCRAVLVARGGETEWELSPIRMPDCIATDLRDAARRIHTLDRPIQIERPERRRQEAPV